MFAILRKWPAASMFVLALLVTFVVGLPLAIILEPIERSLGFREELLSLWVMRWGATIAGFIILAIVAGRHGFTIWLRQLLRWRVGPSYYLFIYISALALFIISLVLTFWLFQPLPETVAAPGARGLVPSYLGEIAYVTLTNGEETGWRFVLLGLLLTRMRLFPATLLVALAWVAWHLPMYLFLGGGGPTMFAPFIVIGIGLSFLLSWLYKATDSLLLPILFHGAVNATTYTFERHFMHLNDALEALGPVGEWMYAIALVPVVAAILVGQRRLFFGQVEFRPGENWATRQ